MDMKKFRGPIYIAIDPPAAGFDPGGGVARQTASAADAFSARAQPVPSA